MRFRATWTETHYREDTILRKESHRTVEHGTVLNVVLDTVTGRPWLAVLPDGRKHVIMVLAETTEVTEFK